MPPKEMALGFCHFERSEQSHGAWSFFVVLLLEMTVWTFV